MLTSSLLMTLHARAITVAITISLKPQLDLRLWQLEAFPLGKIASLSSPGPADLPFGQV